MNITAANNTINLTVIATILDKAMITVVAVFATIIAHHVLRLYWLRYYKKVMIELAHVARETMALEALRKIIEDLVRAAQYYECKGYENRRSNRMLNRLENVSATIRRISIIVAVILVFLLAIMLTIAK